MTFQLDGRTCMAGLCLSTIVFLILSSQLWVYFRRRAAHCNDPLWIKVTVVFIWMMQALELALTARMGASSSKEYPTSAHGLAAISIEWAVYIATCSLTSFLVHVIFVRRIYLLCEKLYGDRKLSSVIGLVTMLEGGFGLVSTVFVARINQDNSPYGPLKWPIPLWLGCSGTADALIACTLCCIFNANRTGSPQSELIINRLVKFCVQTGLITFLTAGTTVAIWEAADFDIFHLLMSFPMGGIYATCLMANFLARESYLRPRCAPEDVENMSVPGGTVVASEDLRCPPEKSSVKSGMKDTSIRSVSEST